ncbi:MAG TPA: hypothetical protein VHL78_00490 [Actinomycetota bacterium]|nr:hypothetical protein [Actinomycetota bacterium]
MKVRHEGEQPLRVLDQLGTEFMRVSAAEPARRFGIRPVVMGIALLAFATAGIITAIAVDSTPNPAADDPALNNDSAASRTGAKEEGPRLPSGFSASGTVYQSLQELVTKSDLIVIGTVEQTVVGKVSNDDPDAPTVHLHTTVTIEETLKGSPPASEVIVHTLELAFKGPGIEDWREAGHRVLLFLTPSTESPDRHILSNVNYLQTTYFVDGDHLSKTIGGDLLGVSDRVAAMTVSELRAFVGAQS